MERKTQENGINLIKFKERDDNRSIKYFFLFSEIISLPLNPEWNKRKSSKVDGNT